jgi:ubiquinol-cytochrome c reductase cytochrome b subunit
MYASGKSNFLFKVINNTVVDLPTPARISGLWNFGSLLGLCLGLQLLTGLLLSLHYFRRIDVAFESISHIIRDVNSGWIVRVLHANGARIFFIALYVHIARGLYFSSFSLSHTWIVGVSILLATIATAFLGYVLPWGQISFWGATVITNLFSAIPYIGGEIVYWLWGGFAVRGPTLSRFFGLHFLMPFVISGLVLIHLMCLHQTGSSNPLGISRNPDKIRFHPYFIWKDLFGFALFFIAAYVLIIRSPWLLGDTENFIPANPLVTPIHIQPEWYFLFAYAILRSIPNKLGGVVALALAVLVLYLLPLKTQKFNKRTAASPAHKALFWLLVNTVIILTWIGARPVEAPYLLLGQVTTVIYFRYFCIVLI